MSKVSCVVVLFNPELNVIENINSYADQVDKLYVIDNSDRISDSIIQKIQSYPNMEYMPNKVNLGIAAALNIGAKKAIDEGFEYLLTMDQDSKAPPSLVSHLIDCFSKDTKIASVSPVLQNNRGRKIKHSNEKQCEQVATVWTSGNLLDLKIFENTGGFKEDLFIDYVDHEFCLRLNKLGYKIYICNDVILQHNLGNIEEINLLFRKVYTTNHSALRLYYRTRNRFYVKQIYKDSFPDFFKKDNKDFWRTFLKVILFEKDKLKKINYTIKGYNDYRKNIFGKFNSAPEILITILIVKALLN